MSSIRYFSGMDLIPKPGQIAAAASNVAHTLLYGGLADLRPMPRTLIDEGLLREVYHYRPSGKVQEEGDPVLLVTPLAAPSLCFDLRRGCSLVEHLVTEGRRTYLVEYGEVAFRDRNLGMEHWVEEVVPRAIEEVSAHAGGRPVHVIGWSLGGIFAALAAADRPDLPIASLTIVGSPFDLTKVPLLAPVRPLLNSPRLPERLKVISKAYRMMGGAPKPLVRWAFKLSAADKLVTKPLVKLKRLDDTEFLAQIEAVDRFTANMIAYPGRSFGQLYHRFVRGNVLREGRIDFGDHTIELKNVKVPVLVFGGADDGIAPLASVKSVTNLLTGSPEVRWEIVPGGHLGMLTGRAARNTTWKVFDGWIGKWSGGEGAEEVTQEPPAEKAAAAKVPAEKAPAKKATAAKTAAPDKIGSNPTRRYGSGSSRALSG
jgi:polyhydroxyalkanoate synthase